MECRPPRQGALDTGESRYGRLGRRENPLDFEQLPGRIQGKLTLVALQICFDALFTNARHSREGGNLAVSTGFRRKPE